MICSPWSLLCGLGARRGIMVILSVVFRRSTFVAVAPDKATIQLIPRRRCTAGTIYSSVVSAIARKTLKLGNCIFETRSG